MDEVLAVSAGKKYFKAVCCVSKMSLQEYSAKPPFLNPHALTSTRPSL